MVFYRRRIQYIGHASLTVSATDFVSSISASDEAVAALRQIETGAVSATEMAIGKASLMLVADTGK